VNNTDRSLFSALPMWAQGLAMVGVPSFIALALLGFIPGVTSPIDRLEHALTIHNDATANELEKNREVQKSMVQVLRAICYRLPSSGQLPKCE
jgi:hypothetical protein